MYNVEHNLVSITGVYHSISDCSNIDHVLLFFRQFITCKTPRSDEGVVTVMVTVDRFTGTTPQNFEYVRNPKFSEIMPDFSFIS